MRHGPLLEKIFGAVGDILNYYFNMSLDLARLQSDKMRLQVLRGLRYACLGYVVISAFIGLTLFLIGMFHLFLLLIIPNKIQAVLVLLFLDLFLVAGIGWLLFSEKNWIKFSNFDDLSLRDHSELKHRQRLRRMNLHRVK